MAIRSAWWMKNPTPPNPTRVALRLPRNTQAPHMNWPQSLTDSGLAFGFLERYLAEHPGDACQVYQFGFGLLQEKLLWRQSAVISSTVDLERRVRDQVRYVQW